MISLLSFRKCREAKTQQAVDRGWNACLDSVQKLVGEHQWVAEEDDPKEVFCDYCGQSLTRALEGMRR